MSLKRLTDLFEEGVTLPVTAKGGEVIPLWIAKLTPFEVEQSNHEGRIARARKMLAIKEVDNPEFTLFNALMADMPKQEIIDSLVREKANEFVLAAIRGMRSEEEWKERLEVMEWSPDQTRGLAPDHEDIQLLEKVLREYESEVERRTLEAGQDLRAELSDLTPEALHERYRDSYIDQRGLTAFSAEQQKNQIYLALRQCQGVERDGVWVHDACNHRQRWLDGPQDVESLPESLLMQIRVAYAEMSMSPDVARFSEGPASSSASSGPSSKQEDLAASGQTATSDAPAGT